MIDLEDELTLGYLSECRKRLASVETDLRAVRKGGAEVDLALIDHAFRDLHWMQGAARLFDLGTISDLARQAENILALVQSRSLAVTPDGMGVLLDAMTCLRELVDSPEDGKRADITRMMAALMMLDPNRRKDGVSEYAPTEHNARRLRSLLVEDDFSSRLLLQTFLARYGECHVAVNGREAVEAFRKAFDQGQRYSLICMDIMMPEMDGREAVRQIRKIEEGQGIFFSSGARIIMTTALDDIKEVGHCFNELCDAYLVKPIDLSKLLEHMKAYNLVQ